MELREDQAWLLQSRFSPFPVPGALTLEGGHISFTLDESAAGESLGWLEKQLGASGLAERIAAGEPVVVFDHPLDECEVAWPITGGGAMMLVRAPERTWVVSYDDPAASTLHQTLALFSGRHKAKDWKKAFASLGL